MSQPMASTVYKERSMQGDALIYCRVSTRNQEESGTSFDSQEELCRRRAEELGYTIGRVTREVYSGATLWDRPLLARDRVDIRLGRFQALIAHSADRLSRDPVHLALIAEECRTNGTQLMFVTDRVSDGTSDTRIEGYLAKIERDKIRERATRGRQQRVRNGKLPRSGTDLYGYRRTTNGDRRDVYEPEAIIVRRVYQWFAEDALSMRQITRRLNEDGILPPSAGKRRPYVRTDLSGQQWNTVQVRLMLREPAYKGETYMGRHRSINGKQTPVPREDWVRLPDDVSPPIIDRALWDAAQYRLSTNSSFTARAHSAPPALLRGRIHCGVCARPMRPLFRPDRGLFYKCSSAEHGGSPCGGRTAPAESRIVCADRPRDALGRVLPIDDLTREHIQRAGVDDWVWERVSVALCDSAILAELERQRQAAVDAVLESDLHTAQRARDRIDDLQQLLRARDSESGGFPREFIRDHIHRLEQEKSDLQTAIDELTGRIVVQQRTASCLASLMEYFRLSSRPLVEVDLDRKRRTLEALDIRVVANGREWTLTSSMLPASVHRSGAE
jgi:DNA invertase Pin-like site-specific DNA recombinase